MEHEQSSHGGARAGAGPREQNTNAQKEVELPAWLNLEEPDGVRKEELETALKQVPQPHEITTQPQHVKKHCPYCGAEVRREALICGKCGMPAMYRK